MSTMHRSQILLEQEQYQALSSIAKREGRSISALVREALDQYLAALDKELKLEQELLALQKLKLQREKILRQHGELSEDFLAAVREERDSDLDRVLSDGP